jgi:AcrR family transcriptional regulator
MARWQPDSRGRLAQAALELFAEQGYAATSPAAIAERAGLTERTFYRYFPDRRDVLFGGEDRMRERLVDAVATALPATSTGEALRRGLTGLASELQPGRAHAQKRAQVIFAEPELTERELAKVSAWTTALAQVLTDRNLPPGTAWLAAELAMALFRAAYRLWVTDPGEPDLTILVDRMICEAGPLLTAGGAEHSFMPVGPHAGTRE